MEISWLHRAFCFASNSYPSRQKSLHIYSIADTLPAKKSWEDLIVFAKAAVCPWKWIQPAAAPMQMAHSMSDTVA
ncbi:MAG TPA: hypothetical protein PK198_06900, partial [Saprospiraceae bacterium]|nr:hypothetical protein [Saprospiraceae bacterium]